MRILFVQPGKDPLSFGLNEMSLVPPIGLEAVAAMVPDHDRLLLDLRLGGDLTEVMTRFQPDLVATTALTTESHLSLAALQRVKHLSRRTITVVGGHHATLLPADYHHPDVDYIVRGEGETAFRNLVSELDRGRRAPEIPGVRCLADGQVVVETPRERIVDLDGLPHPARELTAAYRANYSFIFRRPLYMMETARGCPYRCTFCSVWKFFQGKCRYRSPARVVEEIAAIPGREILIIDDNFMQTPKRIEAIADRLLASGIKKNFIVQTRVDHIVAHPGIVEKWAAAGMSIAAIGTESVTQDTLNRLKKETTKAQNERAVRILQANGIETWGCFIIDPSFSVADFRLISEYAERLGFTYCQFSILTPLPGTPLYDDVRDQLLSADYRDYDFLHSVLPTRLPPDVFYGEFARLYKRFYMSWRAFARALLQRRMQISPRQVLRQRRMVRRLARPAAYAQKSRKSRSADAETGRSDTAGDLKSTTLECPK